MANKRIIQLTETLDLTNSSFVAVDGQVGGSKKFDLLPLSGQISFGAESLGVDLNAVRRAGTYRVTAASQYINGPQLGTSFTGWLVVFNVPGSAAVNQTLYLWGLNAQQSNAAKIYTRSFDVVWTPWYEQVAIVASAHGLTGPNFTAGWYRVYSDGWIEQGARTPMPSVTAATVTMPLAFKDTEYTIILSPEQVGATTTGGRAFNTVITNSLKTAQSFTVSTVNNANNSMYWEAKGF